jgi:hypothetical protein
MMLFNLLSIPTNQQSGWPTLYKSQVRLKAEDEEMLVANLHVSGKLRTLLNFLRNAYR